ncbi:MAG TPA: DUF4178 domain-containing protein [Solirubrobacteraceae bacterium]|jgi:hypothetical protein|nr:DUF4178 domain-containing protein [Solirubrobacteraceae bacterium]
MEAVVVIVAVVLAAAAGVAFARRRGAAGDTGGRRRELPPLRSPEDEQRALHGDVRRLAPGDAVSYEGTDFLVDRTMRFDQGGYAWKEHLLSDAVSGRRMWLSVEEDDGLEVAVWERVPEPDVEPGPAELTYDGRAYERQERGSARFRTEQTGGGAGESGTMEYVEYAAGERLLVFERYGTGAWEVSTGRAISEHLLDVYPRG